MYLKLLLSLLLFSSSASATDINWFKSQKLGSDSNFTCPEITQFINSFETNPNNNFTMWSIDLNQDSVKDYIIVAGVSGYCGSAGCTSRIFLNKGNSCKSISSPYLSHNQKVGFNGSNIFLSRGQCGVWKLLDTKLVHIENKKNCE